MKILLLGIGNILFQDEGMGSHFVHYMDQKYSFQGDDVSLDIIDGGTLAQRLIPLIIDYDEVIVVDCIDTDSSKPGEVYFFDYRKIPAHVNWQGSAHEVEMLQTLNMIEMNGDLPHTNVLGIVPKRVADDTTFELSSEMYQALPTMESKILEHLKTLGINIKSVDEDVTLKKISNISYKREMEHN
ncbi:MAG: HyaD/HybD family hydrogenase maturation endopeptidase [Campylobacterales bacterium]|nr:HyaD/HybD family hydrogenase maturation endopeptidase [Campylobacterales bacterium]